MFLFRQRKYPSNVLGQMSSSPDTIFPVTTRRRHLRPPEDTTSATVAFQVVGSGEAPGGIPRALLLYTAKTRYIFNCPEGTQRILAEQGPPRIFANLDAVFCTGEYLIKAFSPSLNDA